MVHIPTKKNPICPRKASGTLLGFLLSLAGTGVSGVDLPPIYPPLYPGAYPPTLTPGGVTRNAGDFEQILGFQGLFRDAGQGMATVSELKMPIAERLLPEVGAPAHLSSVERGYFNQTGTPQSHCHQDRHGNIIAVTQSAPLTEVQLQVPGSGNRLDIRQTGYGANTALQLSGEANRVRITQTGPGSTIKMEVQAKAADLSVQQTSKDATFIFSGTLAEKGRLSVAQ